MPSRSRKWSATARKFAPISQESTAFFEDHEVFDDEEVQVMSVEGGKRIAVALGDTKGVILRNHGLLTVGGSVDEAVGWFLIMERVSETHLKAGDLASPNRNRSRGITERFRR